jgi:hypothetical protein
LEYSVRGKLVIVGSLTGTPRSHSLLVGGSEVVGQPKIVAIKFVSNSHTNSISLIPSNHYPTSQNDDPK